MTKKPEAGLSGQPERCHRIRHLEIEGGFLDGLKLEFTPDLNCLIGGRGAGKTTALELLRWTLKEPAPSAARRELHKLVTSNLGKGAKVKVAIETKDGLRYTVSRHFDEEPVVLDDQARPTGLTLAHGVIFDVEVYSQSEIEQVAVSPALQLALIDRVAGPELRAVKERIRQVRGELEANTRDVEALTRELRELDEGLKELPLVQAKVAEFRAQGAATPAGVTAAVDEKGLREREVRTVSHVEQLLRDQRDALNAAAVGLGHDALVPLPALRGPNGGVLRAIGDAVAECRDETRRIVATALAALDRCAAKVEAARAGLAKNHDLQERRYWELMAHHDRERARSQERLHFERRQHELLERQQRRDQKREALQVKVASRDSLLAAFSSLRDERYALRHAVTEGWNAQLAPSIQVTVRQGADRSAFRSALSEAFRDAGKKKSQDIVDLVVDAYTPTELTRALRRNDAPTELVALGVSAQRASWFVEELRDTPVPAAAEAVDLDDLPRIELQDGDKHKVAADLSTGQKCTTILPILLLESDKPLLVDQPEDHLDNRFVYEVVVSRVRDVKRRRQLVFVTHNPNIPVLGEASRVFVLQSNGSQAELQAAGTVDDVREHVATILEGGRAAFEARRARYGY